MAFELPDFDNHEAVVHVSDDASGLRAIIAIHSTALGPAHGGVRFWHYDSSQAALTDALRLSRGMTYKNAVAGLAFGGGKAVIMAPPHRAKSPALLHAFGTAVEKLAGRYILAEDVGIAPADVALMAERTSHACGVPTNGDDAAANPAPHTARGVFLGLQAGWARLQGQTEATRLDGVTVAVQGVGSVGLHLCRLLTEAGASLIVTDTNAAALEQARQLGATTVEPDAIYDARADIFAPCAMGASLNPVTLPRLQVKLICGAANNQLATPDIGEQLAARDILYLPDFVVNAGGVTHTTAQIGGLSLASVNAKIDEIPARIDQVLTLASSHEITPQAAAEQLARAIISKAHGQ